MDVSNVHLPPSEALSLPTSIPLLAQSNSKTFKGTEFLERFKACAASLLLWLTATSLDQQALQ
jgi:hypothetical protein